MTPEHDRDRALEDLLRRRLAEASAEASTGACLDADTLAAWVDRRLAREDLAAAQAHAAGCARCQVVLAAMARTTPASAAPSSWRLPFRWIVPFAAAAAAVVIWIAVVPEDLSVPPPSRTAEQTAAAPASTVEPGGSPPAAPPTMADTAPSVARSTAPASIDEVRTKARVPRQEEAKRETPRRERFDREVKTDAADDRVAKRVLTAPSAAPIAAARTAPSVPPSVPPATTDLAAASSRFAVAASLPVVASPDPLVLWRIVVSGVVEKSVDGGATWTTQPVGGPVVLTAGSSPSRDVCWFAGRAGTVLLSTDGRTWQRLAFPEAVDLIAVRATDARTASVTASDGRQFTTRDAGKTWTTPPLQESAYRTRSGTSVFTDSCPSVASIETI